MKLEPIEVLRALTFWERVALIDLLVSHAPEEHLEHAREAHTIGGVREGVRIALQSAGWRLGDSDGND